MHSCELYEDAMDTLSYKLKEKLEMSKQTGISEDHVLSSTVKRVETQIQLDTGLFSNILKETEQIKKSKEKKGFFRNVVKSITSGRVDKIEEYSVQLNSRFQIISTLMIKDMWQVLEWCCGSIKNLLIFVLRLLMAWIQIWSVKSLMLKGRCIGLQTSALIDKFPLVVLLKPIKPTYLDYFCVESFLGNI